MIAEWADVSHPPQFADTQVHLWLAELNLVSPERFEADLSVHETARAERFLNRTARNAYVVSHGILRHLIAGYRDIRPGAVDILTTPGGKPFLPDTNLHFSLSHSGEAALFAFALDTEVGVDIERIGSTPVDIGVAELVLTSEELQALKRYEDHDRALAFFRGWTRKEAYAKCRGIGLDNLTHVQLGLSEGVASVDGISLCTFRCAKDLIGSLATRGEPNSVTFIRWSPPST